MLHGSLNFLLRSRFVRFITGLAAQPLQETKAMSKMQSWQINSYGSIEQLRLEETAVPHIEDANQLLIKVKATALNPIDLEMLGGYGKSLLGVLRWYHSEFPLVLGREFAGTVVNKGRSVSDEEFKVGDEVFGIVAVEKQGSLREYLLAEKSNVLLRPAHVSVVEAASVLYTSITAWSAIFSVGRFTSQDLAKTKVLLLGASGGVGTVATQILRSQNATVVCVCSTDAVPLVSSLGANHVYDYKNPEHIQQVASHGVYDVILDCAKYGYENIPKDWKHKMFITLNSPLLVNTDRYGLIFGLGVSASEFLSANVPAFFGGKSVRWAFFAPQPKAFKFLDNLIKNQQLKPIVQKVFNFSDASAAFSKLAGGHLRGKIVIDLQQNTSN